MDISCKLSSLTGLTGRQVEAKKAQGRQNILPESAAKPTGQILRENICTLFNLFNVLIAIALALVGAWSNMLFILVIALNTLIGIAQELHAKKLVERLTLLSTPMARVIRDGIAGDIPLQELVEEDVVELEAGSQVCADCIMLTGEAEVNESLLTGEAEPVLQKVGDRLLSGSYIVSGRCRACVEHVGAENYAAKVTQAAQKQRRARSELLSSMRQVTRFTGCLIPPLGLLLFFEAYFLRFDTLDHAVTATAAALLGMLPKGLVLLISISLAAGIISLSRKKVLVQELFALETLAHVDTLCLDKTGTITQGRMRVEKVLATQRGKKLAFNDLMGAFLHISKDNNATYQALKAYFPDCRRFNAVHSIPFSSERKWSAVEFANIGTLVVGAPECVAPGQGGESLKRETCAGRRVLMAGLTKEEVRADAPLPQVECLALLVLADPIRENAVETLAYFHAQGVSLKLISGDDPLTASAVAAQAGLPDAERYIDMSNITGEEEIEKAALTHTVFGRVSPSQKKQLVQALQSDGHCVAMTGDGVNDLMALRAADLGIAVASGSDATRQAAQVVLLDSNIGALPAILSEGRRVVNNITRVAGVFFIKTIYSLLLSVLCILLDIPFPLVPVQITLIDLIIEGYPAFFMSFEPDGRRITGRFLPNVLRRAAPFAAAIAVCFLTLNLLSSWMRISQTQVNTLFYLLIGTVGLGALFAASRPLNRLRAFLCATTAMGFYIAVFLFHGFLHIVLPTNTTLLYLLSFSMLSLLVTYGATIIARKTC